MASLTLIDLIFASIIFIFAIKCAVVGLVAEILKKLSIVFGLFFAFALRSSVASFLFESNIVKNRFAAEALALLLVFIFVFVAIQIVMHIIGAGIKSVKILSSLDKTLGFFFGIIEGCVVVMIILWLLCLISSLSGVDFCSKSLFFNLLMPSITPEMQEYVPVVPVTTPA